MPTRNRDYSAIITRLNGSVWYITEPAMNLMIDILNRHIVGEVDRESIRVRFGGGDRESGSGGNEVLRGIGILPLQGPIFPKANMMTEMSGATSIEQFQQSFRSLMANDFVSAIILDIDSPGGSAEMIPEMAAEIRSARDSKPIIAVANTAACSAAMYLAAQATKVYASPSAQVGSIGTIATHVDNSEKEQKEGIKTTYITAGEYKADLAKPLTEESKGRIQAFVDHHYAMFVNDMAEGRNTTVEDVVDNYGKGFIMTPNQAQDVGMIDGIQSFDSVLGRLIESGGDIEALDSTPVGVSARGARLTLRDSYDADKEHSEPGTGQGGEPTPREPPEKDDPAIKGGWRRDPPPIAYEPEEMVMGRDRLEAIAASLGIEFSEETPDEDLGALVEARVSEVITPLHEATAKAEAQKQWEQDYPEQARELARLASRDREHGAQEFAESFKAFADEPSKGFSPVVREELKKAHLAISDRTFSHGNLTELVSTMASKTAVVEYGEGGSARDTEKILPVDGNARQQFAQLVRAYAEEHGMDRKSAVAAVSQQNPELARAYMETGR